MKMERYEFCGNSECEEWLAQQNIDVHGVIPCAVCKRCMEDGPASCENPEAADLDREVVCGRDPEKDFKSISERAVKRILDHTEGTPDDCELSNELALLMKATKSETAASYVAVGRYFDQSQLDDSESCAIHWYAMAALKGDPWSMWRMGSLYQDADIEFDGLGCDNVIAFACFRRAAELGDCENVVGLGRHVGAAWVGTCYAHGQGVPVDRKKAVKWWTMAAKLGNTMAANCLKNPLFPNDVGE